MPWKNGQGSTAEIDIFPPNANVTDSSFDYRLSSAKVGAAGPFSRFPGYDRILCVIEGEALRINGYRHEPLAPFSFSGEEEIYAALYGTDILDLGVIYRRGVYEAKMQVLDSTVHQAPLNLEEGIHFFFCAAGSLNVNGSDLNKGDALKMQNEKRARVQLTSGAHGIWIFLKKI
jgi:environmental stress-induced protein Ves